MHRLLWDNLFRRTPRDREIQAVLEENVLFQDLTASELRFVVNIVHLRHYRNQETIFHQNEIGVGMYVIQSGGVAISMDETDAGAVESGEQINITELGPGDFFGEISLVEEDGRRTASARATADSTLIGFFKPDLMDIFERNPRAGVKIIFRLGQVLGRRLKETTQRLTLLEKELKP